MKPCFGVDERQAALELVSRISDKLHDSIVIMEVCGTHTMAIRRYGIDKILPVEVKLVSGPGCPVCVTDMPVIDSMIRLSRQRDVIIVTFGDMMRVPGSESSLYLERACGARVEVVYSPLAALDIAAGHPDKIVVFMAVGFETTAPAVAVTVFEARKRGIKNFKILCAHKTMPEALKAIIRMDNRIDGFLLPGNVSVITGRKAFSFIAEKYMIPGVIAGFEPLDILYSVYMIADMLYRKMPEVENEYSRVVSEEGNTAAQEMVAEVFEPCDSSWRGLGTIRGSGLKLSDEYSDLDIENVFDLKAEEPMIPPECICGEILCGTKMPEECLLFGKTCVPENPVGPCMVSIEGTCSAHYKYRGA